MTFPDQRRRLAICAGVALASFVAYAATLGSGPYWQDAGIFLAGLRQGGGLAPPGYPLYLMLGQPFVWVFTLLGLDHARAVHVFSAVWAALTAGIVTSTILLLATPGIRFFSGPSSPDTPAAPLAPAAQAAGAIGGCLAFQVEVRLDACRHTVNDLDLHDVGADDAGITIGGDEPTVCRFGTFHRRVPPPNNSSPRFGREFSHVWRMGAKPSAELGYVLEIWLRLSRTASIPYWLTNVSNPISISPRFSCGFSSRSTSRST